MRFYLGSLPHGTGEAGAAAGVVCTALRALESLAARDAALPLPAMLVAGALSCPALLFSSNCSGGRGVWRGGWRCEPVSPVSRFAT